jgi:ribosome small subunit-dependent GTPase A
LIDSPGIREFGLWHMEEAEVLEGFIEFKPFIGHCKFRDCSHRHEPGCAILKALDDGTVSGGSNGKDSHLRQRRIARHRFAGSRWI